MRIPEQIRLYIVFFLSIFFFVFAAKCFLPLVTPFVCGMVLASLIEWPVAKVRRWLGLPRNLAVIFVLCLTLLLLSLGLTFFFLRLYAETRDLLITLPGRLTLLARALNHLETEIYARLQWPEELWDHGRLWMDQIQATIGGLLQGVLNLFRGLPLFLLNLFLSGLTAFFFSKDRAKINHFFFTLVPDQWRKTIRELYRQTLVWGWGFLKAQFILAMITGLFSALCLGLFGFPNPWLTGFFLGIADFLPLVGPAVLFLPWIGWQLAVGQLRKAFFLGVTFLLTIGLRQLLEVRLVGAELGLHPLLVLLSLYIGVKSFGVYGFFFGPILCVLVRSLYQGLFSHHNRARGFGFNEGE
ncbi:MAG: AI-2E family transporter [Firmicutes bacterium]|nr:AI-2E family transporter [Bacillota bacterium]